LTKLLIYCRDLLETTQLERAKADLAVLSRKLTAPSDCITAMNTAEVVTDYKRKGDGQKKDIIDVLTSLTEMRLKAVKDVNDHRAG
jgi:hypothetical protein